MTERVVKQSHLSTGSNKPAPSGSTLLKARIADADRAREVPVNVATQSRGPSSAASSVVQPDSDATDEEDSWTTMSPEDLREASLYAQQRE